MKKETYKYPHSSFLSVEKDMSLIIDHIFKNDRLKKLLYYTTKDCLSKPKLTEDQTLAMLGKQIKIIPKIEIDSAVQNYIIIRFNDFMQSENPEFRDNTIEFNIICHFDQWQMKDFQLRPYKIAAELDTMFNNQHLTGIGTLEFLGATQKNVNEEFAGLQLIYEAIHGEEDKINSPTEEDELELNFNEIFNIK